MRQKSSEPGVGARHIHLKGLCPLTGQDLPQRGRGPANTTVIHQDINAAIVSKGLCDKRLYRVRVADICWKHYPRASQPGNLRLRLLQSLDRARREYNLCPFLDISQADSTSNTTACPPNHSYLFLEEHRK